MYNVVIVTNKLTELWLLHS